MSRRFSEVARLSIEQGDFGPAQAVRGVTASIEAEKIDPLLYEAGILPRR